MPEWLDIAAKALVTITAFTGAILGIWSRLDQARENRRKREKELPDVVATIGEEKDGWKRLVFAITPREQERFEVMEVIIGKEWLIAQSSSREETRPARFRGSFWEQPSAPSRKTISVPYPDPSSASRTLTVKWDIKGKRRQFLLWISSPAQSFSVTSEASIQLICRSISAKRERFTLTVKAIDTNQAR